MSEILSWAAEHKKLQSSNRQSNLAETFTAYEKDIFEHLSQYQGRNMSMRYSVDISGPGSSDIVSKKSVKNTRREHRRKQELQQNESIFNNCKRLIKLRQQKIKNTKLDRLLTNSN